MLCSACVRAPPPSAVEAVSASPEDPHARARALLTAGEYLAAAELLDRAPEEDLEATRLLGRALLAHGAAEVAEHELEAAALERRDLVATRQYVSAVMSVDGTERRALYAAVLFGIATDDAAARLASWVWLARLGEDPGPAPRPEGGGWPAALADVLEGRYEVAALLDELSGASLSARRSFAHYLLGEAALAGVGPWRAGPDEAAATRHFQAALRAGHWQHAGYALSAFLLDDGSRKSGRAGEGGGR